MRRLIIIGLAALTLTLGVRADTPNVYAIRGARIVTAAGATIESGTIVVRHGLIDAVGPSVTPPSDADVIDGSGLTVYPGLIDLGNSRAADQPAPRPPRIRARRRKSSAGSGRRSSNRRRAPPTPSRWTMRT